MMIFGKFQFLLATVECLKLEHNYTNNEIACDYIDMLVVFLVLRVDLSAMFQSYRLGSDISI